MRSNGDLRRAAIMRRNGSTTGEPIQRRRLAGYASVRVGLPTSGVLVTVG
jgi:hypothetical protein